MMGVKGESGSNNRIKESDSLNEMKWAGSALGNSVQVIE